MKLVFYRKFSLFLYATNHILTRWASYYRNTVEKGKKRIYRICYFQIDNENETKVDEQEKEKFLKLLNGQIYKSNNERN